MTTTLRTTAQILASLPAVLGYVPTDRAIVIATHRPHGRTEELRLALATDINAAPANLNDFARVCGLTRNKVTGAILVAITERTNRRHATDVLDALANSLAGEQIPVYRRIFTTSIDAGTLWTDIDTNDSGITSDYRDAEMVAQAVSDGRVIAASRADIDAELAETTPAAPAQAVDTTNAAQVQQLANELIDAIANTAADSTLASRIGGVIVSDINARDLLVGVSARTPGNAAILWTRISSQLRGQARIQALTITAAMSYGSGDGVRAGAALDTARDLAKSTNGEYPSLARLLDVALQGGIAPNRVLTVLTAHADKYHRR